MLFITLDSEREKEILFGPIHTLPIYNFLLVWVTMIIQDAKPESGFLDISLEGRQPAFNTK